MQQTNRPFALVLLTSLAIVLSACGSAGSDTDDSDTPDAVSPTSVASSTSEPSPDQGGSGLTAEENGSGLVRVDGVEYADFVGECAVHRGLDPETYEAVPVGDLSEGDLSVLVAIDNVASNPALEANFVITVEPNFRMAGFDVAGIIDSIAYIDPPTPFGSIELARVAFTGTTDTGIPVVAEVVCEIGLG